MKIPYMRLPVLRFRPFKGGARSISARFCIASALWLSAILHLVTIFPFLAAGCSGNLEEIYRIA